MTMPVANAATQDSAIPRAHVRAWEAVAGGMISPSALDALHLNVEAIAEMTAVARPAR
jgi:hypothetical protein